MISTITRHMINQLLTNILFVTLVILGGVWLTQSLKFLTVIVNQHVSLWGYFSLVAFLIPDLIAVLLPICVFIGGLYTYNKMINEHQLVALQATGFSFNRLSRPAFIVGVGIAIFVVLLNIFVVPSACRHLRALEHEMTSRISTAFVREGAFNSVQDLTVYVREKRDDGGLEGVFIYKHSKNEPKSFTITAERGAIDYSMNEPKLVLINGTRQDTDKESGRTTHFKFKSLTYELSKLAEVSERTGSRPSEKDIMELLNPPDEGITLLKRARLISQGHIRILMPFLAIAFALLGACLILNGTNARQKRYPMLIILSVLAVTLYGVSIALLNMSDRGKSAIIAAYVLVFGAILVLLGVFYFKKTFRVKYKIESKIEGQR